MPATTEDAVSPDSGTARLPRGVRVGPYEITGFLGAGGMGEVYRAHDTNLNRVVALKLLPADLATDPDRLRRFEQEARRRTWRTSLRGRSGRRGAARRRSSHASMTASRYGPIG